MVSDVSLDELHAFAATLEIPQRGFHRDHYDLPETYREHDVLDENDIYEFDLTSAWLDSQGIQLSDWFVVTERNSRSIPTEFGRSTNWPN